MHPGASGPRGARVILLLLILVPLAGVCTGDTESQLAASQVSVSAVVLDPGIFMSGETGTILITLANSGTQSVPIRRADIEDNSIKPKTNLYNSIIYLGPGTAMNFSYTVEADAPPGIYYPVFSVGFRDAGFLRYPIKVEVENSLPAVTVKGKPDSFPVGKKEDIRIEVANPRDNPVGSVVITPVCSNVIVTPQQAFIGTLQPDQASEAVFSVTPGEDASLSFLVTFKNGVNAHEVNLPLPLSLGESKRRAEPVTSNIKIDSDKDPLHITGDMTNAGLEVANAVVVTTGEPAVPRDPYRSYVVGALKPDDIAAFEVTFSAENTTEIPLIVSYKDGDGNVYTTRTMVDIGEDNPGKAEARSEFPTAMVSLIVIACATVVGAVLFLSWRRRKTEPLP